jgi:hypothetical protein
MNFQAAKVLAMVALVVLTSPLCSAAPQEKQAALDESIAVGDWRGESICVVRESACHDEDSLYHVARLPEKPGWISMKLDKIVNGKPVTMGTMECSYDAVKQSLYCEFPRGQMRFTISGNKLEGTMTLSDGTLWRKLSLKRS